MQIEEIQHGAVAVVRPVGAVAGADSETLAERTRRVSDRRLGRVALDLSGVPFIDSVGLEALLELADHMAAEGRSLRICGVSETLREVLQLTGITDRFEHYADPASAVRSFL